MWTSFFFQYAIGQFPPHLIMKTNPFATLFHSRASGVRSDFRSTGCESSGPKSISMNPKLMLTIDGARGRFPSFRNLKIAHLMFATYRDVCQEFTNVSIPTISKRPDILLLVLGSVSFGSDTRDFFEIVVPDSTAHAIPLSVLSQIEFFRAIFDLEA
jgi:hypothetical protein